MKVTSQTLMSILVSFNNSDFRPLSHVAGDDDENRREHSQRDESRQWGREEQDQHCQRWTIPATGFARPRGCSAPRDRPRRRQAAEYGEHVREPRAINSTFDC
jgi:hypothetical protein